jgi:hypothetical protein
VLSKAYPFQLAFQCYPLTKEEYTYFLLHRNLDLDPLGMRFRPNKARIDNPNFRQSPQLPQTQRKQLPAFRRRRDPLTWWLQPPIAPSAEVDRRLSLDAV